MLITDDIYNGFTSAIAGTLVTYCAERLNAIAPHQDVKIH